MLMTKTNSSPTFPSLLQNPSGNLVTPFYAVTPSKFCRHPLLCYISPQATSPLVRFSRIRRSKNQGISLPQNQHNGHSMLIEINRHFLVLVTHNDPTPEVFYQHTTACSNFFSLMLLILAVTFNHLKSGIACFPVPST